MIGKLTSSKISTGIEFITGCSLPVSRLRLQESLLPSEGRLRAPFDVMTPSGRASSSGF